MDLKGYDDGVNGEWLTPNGGEPMNGEIGMIENIVRLKAYRVGPKGGRKLEASKIVSAENAYDIRREWEFELNREGHVRYQVTIQDGAIRPRC